MPDWRTVTVVWWVGYHCSQMAGIQSLRSFTILPMNNCTANTTEHLFTHLVAQSLLTIHPITVAGIRCCYINKLPRWKKGS